MRFIAIRSMTFPYRSVVWLKPSQPVPSAPGVFPATDAIDVPAGNSIGAFDPDAVHLEVVVRKDALVVEDGRGGPINGKEGQLVLGQYRILKIGVESVEVAYADGRGRVTLRIQGQP